MQNKPAGQETDAVAPAEKPLIINPTDDEPNKRGRSQEVQPDIYCTIALNYVNKIKGYTISNGKQMKWMDEPTPMPSQPSHPDLEVWYDSIHWDSLNGVSTDSIHLTVKPMDYEYHYHLPDTKYVYPGYDLHSTWQQASTSPDEGAYYFIHPGKKVALQLITDGMKTTSLVWWAKREEIDSRNDIKNLTNGDWGRTDRPSNQDKDWLTKRVW